VRENTVRDYKTSEQGRRLHNIMGGPRGYAVPWALVSPVVYTVYTIKKIQRLDREVLLRLIKYAVKLSLSFLKKIEKYLANNDSPLRNAT
jgi:hypothetical protein